MPVAQLDEIHKAIIEASGKIGAVEQSVAGVHARVGRVEDTVTDLAKTTGVFQTEAVQRLRALEVGLNGTSKDAEEAKVEAKKAGRKAGGLLGTIGSAAVLGLWKLVASLWGKP